MKERKCGLGMPISVRTIFLIALAAFLAGAIICREVIL